eukprot:UN06644
MGCCTSAPTLPKNAKPLSGNTTTDYPRFFELMNALPGEWEVYIIKQGTKQYHSTIAIPKTFVGYQTRNKSKESEEFVWSSIPDDPINAHKLYFDERGSFFDLENTKLQNGEIALNHWQHGTVVWRLPNSVMASAKWKNRGQNNSDKSALTYSSNNVVQNVVEVVDVKHESIPRQLQAITATTAKVCTECKLKKNEGTMYEWPL